MARLRRPAIERLLGGILLAMVVGATVVACTRKQSLFIDPGRADSPVERKAR